MNLTELVAKLESPIFIRPKQRSAATTAPDRVVLEEVPAMPRGRAAGEVPARLAARLQATGLAREPSADAAELAVRLGLGNEPEGPRGRLTTPPCGAAARLLGWRRPSG